MFTGITKGIGKILLAIKSPQRLSVVIEFPSGLADGLEIGASVAVDGVCLTATNIQNNCISFDAIPETVKKTTFKELSEGYQVNLERSARLGDEIGGHLLSGHVIGCVTLNHIEGNVYTFSCPQEWMKYLFPKGYVALNGSSLTLVDIHREKSLFSVHLIPETLRKTTISQKKIGSLINLEIDSATQAIVDTVERTLKTL